MCYLKLLNIPSAQEVCEHPSPSRFSLCPVLLRRPNQFYKLKTQPTYLLIQLSLSCGLDLITPASNRDLFIYIEDRYLLTLSYLIGFLLFYLMLHFLI